MTDIKGIVTSHGRGVCKFRSTIWIRGEEVQILPDFV